MTRSFPVFAVSAALALCCGCMTSRSRCEVEYEKPGDVISSSSEINTECKYRIREIRTGSCVRAGADGVMREAAGTISAVERIMHTCPGVFERDGEEVVVDVVSYERDSSFTWTVVPCILTAGICPYFRRDDVRVTAEVSLIDEPSKKTGFSCRFVDDWKISFLFQLGSIPYPAGALESSRIGRRGHGDVTADVRREGLANGIAKALRELERGH